CVREALWLRGMDYW
nr:immunoglobulin heavy chain junction region [Mus musculus]MBK4196620.1 immunoglobulin heavy chain junction region [Mus musculus]